MQQTKQSYFDDEPKEFSVGYIPKNGTYRIEIDSTIECVSQFSTAIQVLQRAKEDDDVEIYLQTNGGNVNATDAFLHAMHKCQAPIHICATGGVHSAGTHILLAANSFELSDSFNSLIHCGSDGAYGNVNEYRAKSKFDEAFRVKEFRNLYEGFLTSNEIEDVLGGKDIWLDGEAWVSRHNARNDYIAKKYEELQKSQKKTARKTKKVVDQPQ